MDDVRRFFFTFIDESDFTDEELLQLFEEEIYLRRQRDEFRHE